MAAKVRAAIENPLKLALGQVGQEDPAAFKDLFASRQAMGVVFIGFENGAPAVVGFEFQDYGPRCG